MELNRRRRLSGYRRSNSIDASLSAKPVPNLRLTPSAIGSFRKSIKEKDNPEFQGFPAESDSMGRASSMDFNSRDGRVGTLGGGTINVN